MVFSEAEDLAFKYIDSLRTQLFFQWNGVHCKFLGLLVAPENCSLEFKQILYDECIKKGRNEKSVLLEYGLYNEPMTVYIIYLQNGIELVMPLNAYLDNSANNP